MNRQFFAMPYALALSAVLMTACGGGKDNAAAGPPKNLLFFVGSGLGMTTMTAARIYSVGEDGELTLDTLPETAFVKTYSANSQVSDSAAAMSAYMTGVKVNNQVISMSPNTSAFAPAAGAEYVVGADTTCPSTGNGTAAVTLLEAAKAGGLATGIVTTARITDAATAASYAHLCQRDGENTIAAQMSPKGAGFNTALGSGVDVILGGGLGHFLPKSAAGGLRTDGRNLVAEMKTAGYSFGGDKPEFDALPTTGKLLGLFNTSHMAFDLDRDNAREPSLPEMTGRAIDQLKTNTKGMFLLVAGGRINHALQATLARKALQDTVAFDAAIKVAIAKMQLIDPGLKNTLIVVTADHDNTLLLNGDAARTGKTSDTSPGVLGLLRSYVDNSIGKDADGNPYTIIGFGNGENRPGKRNKLTDLQVFDKSYHQEATIPSAEGGASRGGADVFLGAMGMGAASFVGVMDNTAVFGLIRKAAGF